VRRAGSSRQALLLDGLFLTGHELTWMPEALRILRDELPNIDVMISSHYSPLLCGGPFRKEKSMPLFFEGTSAARPGIPLSCEGAFDVILPSDHPLAALKRSVQGSSRRNIRDCVPYGSCACVRSSTNYFKRSGINKSRQLHEAGPCHHGNFLNNVDPAGWAATCCTRRTFSLRLLRAAL